jgi:hypothetical protein
MKLTRQKAINAKCKDCIFDPVGGGSWRQQVERCTSTDCALFEHRPRPVVRNPNPGPVPPQFARLRRGKTD